MLALLGPSFAEQVVIILRTGSGKTMVITVGVSLTDARTVILVVPLFALQDDLLGRFRQIGIQSLL
jgi:superfamily II DNA helicase RecQ